MKPSELYDKDKVLWQGRPAPRCYTFQHWKQALIGSLLFVVSTFWLMIAFELVDTGHPFWLLFLPLPIILGSFYFGPMQIILARWRWPRIFYQMTDKHLYCSVEAPVPLAKIMDIKIKRQGVRLASLRVTVEDSPPRIIHCIEQPDSLIALLQDHCLQLKV